MKALRWIGYALLITGLLLALISAFAPPPGPAAAGWHTVAIWHGDGSASTRTFAVTSPWKVAWKTRPGKLGAAPFQVFVYDETGNIVERVANATGQAQDQRVLRRSGTYYLEIAGAQPYTVTVQEQG